VHRKPGHHCRKRWSSAGWWLKGCIVGLRVRMRCGKQCLGCTPSYSIAATFLLDPYYVTRPVTNEAAIQPHRSEYLRLLLTLQSFNRDFPPTSKFKSCQQRVFLGFVGQKYYNINFLSFNI
jgi:hypothetical protein